VTASTIARGSGVILVASDAPDQGIYLSEILGFGAGGYAFICNKLQCGGCQSKAVAYSSHWMISHTHAQLVTLKK
jgi:hypothetical protein